MDEDIASLGLALMGNNGFEKLSKTMRLFVTMYGN